MKLKKELKRFDAKCEYKKKKEKRAIVATINNNQNIDFIMILMQKIAVMSNVLPHYLTQSINESNDIVTLAT